MAPAAQKKAPSRFPGNRLVSRSGSGNLNFVLSAPAIKATEAQKAASADLEAETANLAEIRKLMAGERREARLDALQRREKASLERIDRLRPQTFTPSVEPIGARLSRYTNCKQHVR
jgi:hypothetical protein